MLFPVIYSTAVAAEQFHKTDSEYLSENSHKKVPPDTGLFTAKV